MKIIKEMEEEKALTKGIDPRIWSLVPSEAQVVIQAFFQSQQQQIGTQQQQIESQQQQIETQQQQINLLGKQVENLKALINQNSHNSSKPPSSDLPSAKKYPPKNPPSGKKRGGQMGHLGHFRQRPAEDKITHYVDHRPVECDHCHKGLPENAREVREAELRYTYELPPPSLIITEHKCRAVQCPHCGSTVYGEVPYAGGAFGPRLHGMVASMRVRGITLGEIGHHLEQIYDLTLSRSTLSEMCRRVNEALEDAHNEAKKKIEQAEIINTDETGWRQNGEGRWLWVQVSKEAVVYHITKTRNQLVLKALLGVMFIGLVCSDRLGIYNSIPPERRQVCLAHLLRNMIGLKERGGELGTWGKRGVKLIEDLFSIWHKFKLGELSRSDLEENMEPLKQEWRQLLLDGQALELQGARRMSVNLLKNWEALWTFVRVEGVEPTNNVSEQALRRPVLWRSLSFGSQSDWGCQFVERMLTVSATCHKQQRPLLPYLEQVILNHWRDEDPLSLFSLAS